MDARAAREPQPLFIIKYIKKPYKNAPPPVECEIYRIYKKTKEGFTFTVHRMTDRKFAIEDRAIEAVDEQDIHTTIDITTKNNE